MLVVFYIISAISSVFAYMYMFSRKKYNIRHWFKAIIISILSGLSFYIPMILKIIESFPNVNFWNVFAVASLFVWQSAFIFNDRDNLINYETAALLLAVTISLVCLTFDTTSYYEACNDEHINVDCIYIWDDNFCDNLIQKTVCVSLRKTTYSFYIVSEDGHPIKKTIPANLTTVYTIDDEESPYLEIIIERDCTGYNTNTQEHSLTIAYTHYNLYIPQDCISVVLEKQNS